MKTISYVSELNYYFFLLQFYANLYADIVYNIGVRELFSPTVYIIFFLQPRQQFIHWKLLGKLALLRCCRASCKRKLFAEKEPKIIQIPPFDLDHDLDWNACCRWLWRRIFFFSQYIYCLETADKSVKCMSKKLLFVG